MSPSSALILLGLLVFLAPFSGFPYSVLNFFLPIFGIAIFAIGFSMRAKRVKDMVSKNEEVLALNSSSPTFETASNIG